MEKINIGYANLCISDKLKKSYFNNDFINESKLITADFLDLLKSSPLLMLEFKVFNNIENKTITSDTIGSRYIDNNIKLFETFTVDEINAEHDKLRKFINTKVNIDEEKEKLYNSISNLIVESVSSYNEINVDDIHESFTTVLNHLKREKEPSVITENKQLVNEDVIEIAINKFNDKYSDLNEDDKKLIKSLVKATYAEKVVIFENYKSGLVKSVNNLDVERYGDKIDLVINKINEMKINKDVIDDNLITLHELKKGFI